MIESIWPGITMTGTLNVWELLTLVSILVSLFYCCAAILYLRRIALGLEKISDHLGAEKKPEE